VDQVGYKEKTEKGREEERKAQAPEPNLHNLRITCTTRVLFLLAL